MNFSEDNPLAPETQNPDSPSSENHPEEIFSSAHVDLPALTELSGGSIQVPTIPYAQRPDVPEDLRMAYHILKNAQVLPPEVELQKEISTLQDLLKYVEEDGERKALAKEIEWKVIRLDLLKKRSMSLRSSRFYGKKLVRRFLHK